jgi:hypothetical protein
MMDRDSDFERFDGRMAVTQPFTTDFQGAVDRLGFVEQRRQVASPNEIKGRYAVAFDPIRLRAEDERALALRSEVPGSEKTEVLYFSRKRLLLRAPWRSFFDEPGNEWPSNIKIEIQAR